MRSFLRSSDKSENFKMDAVEQNDYDVFRRDVYRVDASNDYESQQNRRIIRSIGDDDDDFEDLEALRLAALKSLGTKNSYTRKGLPTADLSSTRRVSLGRDEKSDLQIVALERQGSFSSSSTEYEDIDLSEKTPSDSDANDSYSDADMAESEGKFQSDSNRDDQEMDAKENFDDDDNNDDIENHDVASDEENNILTDEEEVVDSDSLIDEGNIENDVSGSEGDLENNDLLSDEENLQNNSGMSDNDLPDLDNEINILNDISITIANESLVSPPDIDKQLLEIAENDDVEDNCQLNKGDESDNESVDEHHLASSQRIVVSQSDSDNESDEEMQTKMETIMENQSKSKSVGDSEHKKEKKASVASTVTISSGKGKPEVLSVTEGKPKNVVKVDKVADSKVKTSQIAVKSTSSKLPSAEKPKLVSTASLKKASTQEILSKDKSMDKAKQPVNDKVQATQKGSENVLKNAANQGSKVKSSGVTQPKNFLTVVDLKVGSEEKMDFDQLSIEDEDSDFEEEEETQPAVKSKVGLNKMPAEKLKRKRSHSRDKDRKRHSCSPDRFRASTHSYRNRYQDQRSRDRSRDRFNKRRSRSSSMDRTHRGSESRYRRSRSRDRKQSKIFGVRDRDRECRHYRSRSRSNSRTRTSRPDKVVKSIVDKPIKKESIRSSVKERLDVKKKVNERPSCRSPRKEIRTRVSGDEEKTVKVKQAKSSKSEMKVANGTQVVTKPKIQRDVDGVIIKQPKDLRSRLQEKKGNHNEVDTKKESPVNEPTKIVKRRVLSKPQNEATMQRTKVIMKKESKAEDSTDLVKERELDARIQRIKQQNEAILKRAKEIQAEKMKFHS